MGIAGSVPKNVEPVVARADVHAMAIDKAGAGASPTLRIESNLTLSLPVDKEPQDDRFAAVEHLTLHLPEITVGYFSQLGARLATLDSRGGPQDVVAPYSTAVKAPIHLLSQIVRYPVVVRDFPLYD